jgi:hypothetical protein
MLIIDEVLTPLDLLDVEAKIPGRVWRSILADLPKETAKVLGACAVRVNPSYEPIMQAAMTQESVPVSEVRPRFHLRVASSKS